VLNPVNPIPERYLMFLTWKYHYSYIHSIHTLRRKRMVLQSRSGLSFSVSPRLLQLEVCFCSSQQTHTPSLSNLSWGGGGGNTHPHSSRHATYTETHTRTNAWTHTNTQTNAQTNAQIRPELVFWYHLPWEMWVIYYIYIYLPLTWTIFSAIVQKKKLDFIHVSYRL